MRVLDSGDTPSIETLRHRDSETLRHALRPQHVSAEPRSVTECASENTFASRLSTVIYLVLVCPGWAGV